MKLTMPKNSLHFNETEHIYTVDNKRVPSVTTVIKGASTDTDYSMVPERVLKRAGEIGTEVHKCVEHWCVTGGDVMYSDDKSANAYLTPFYDFVNLGALEVEHAEVRLFHPDYWYAGTIDIVGTLWGKPCIMDIKTTNKIDRKYVELQLAAYEILVGFWSGKVDRIFRYALHLEKSGRYTILEFNDPFAEGDFLRILEAYNG